MTARFLRELSVVAALGLLLLVMAIAAPAFFGSDQVRNMLVAAAPTLVAAVGMTLVILCRHIDISIGSQVSVCGVAAGLMAQATVSMPLVVVATVAAGALLGMANGWLVAHFNLPSIVVTLATLVIFREGLRWGREGEFVSGLPPSFQWFGLDQRAGQWLVVGTALAVFLHFAWGMRNLAAGRAVYATGSDAEAARLVGIRPRRVVFGVFTLMGALCGLAAVLLSVRFSSVDPNAGTGLELQVIAAVVVGGTAISGGRGTLFGTLAGVALLAVIGPALVFLGAPSQWEKAIQGFIILAAVATDAFERRAR
ncbi:MAG TPA: ABC transporter permease [Gemmataceae bacterium]|nr:ABC transporter permease [Gemmataceae bacterium]